MIKIGDKTYLADTVIEIHRSNDVPTQKVERGFSVQDHIRCFPIQLDITVMIFEEEETLHGQWDCTRVDGRMECVEKTAVPAGTGTYAYLQQIRDNKELVMVDCSKYERAASMIYPDMAITSIQQTPQRGGVFVCRIIFTQITKTLIVTEQLYIQEVVLDDDGVLVETVLWSKEPIESSNTESLSNVSESEDQPVVRRAPIEAMPSSIKPGGLVNNILDWVAGLF